MPIEKVPCERCGGDGAILTRGTTYERCPGCRGTGTEKIEVQE